MLTNYNSNLDQFLVDNETPVKYRYKSCKKIPKYDGIVCSIKDIKINLLGRYKKYKLHINWDLPVNCIDINEVYLFYKREKHNDNQYKMLKIDYNNKSEEHLYDFGKLHVYKDFSNIKYNFFFKNPQHIIASFTLYVKSLFKYILVYFSLKKKIDFSMILYTFFIDLYKETCKKMVVNEDKKTLPKLNKQMKKMK